MVKCGVRGVADRDSFIVGEYYHQKMDSSCAGSLILSTHLKSSIDFTFLKSASSDSILLIPLRLITMSDVQSVNFGIVRMCFARYVFAVAKSVSLTFSSFSFALF